MTLPTPGYFTQLRIKEMRAELYGPELGTGYTPQIRPYPSCPDYAFFIYQVCLCKKPNPKWVDYNKFTATKSEDLIPFTCRNCDLLDPVSFKCCPTCHAAFYDLFRHPNQGNKPHRCWKCCEEEEANGEAPMAWFVKSGYTKLAPPAWLLAP